MLLDSSKGLVLFDGHRAHAVEPFVGERYSIVFFNLNGFDDAPQHAREFFDEACVPFPDVDTVRYFANLLAPPRGYDGRRHQQSIRRSLFGFAERAQYRQWGSVSFASISAEDLDAALSNVVTPFNMATLGAVSRKFYNAARRPSAWAGTVVDTSRLRPLGHLAHTHWTLWSKTKCVVAGAWQMSNVSLLLSPSFHLWNWQRRNGSVLIALRCGRRAMMVSKQAIGASRFAVRFGGAPFLGKFCIGFATSPIPNEISSAFDGNGRVERGPAPRERVDVDFLCAVVGNGQVAFRHNGALLASRMWTHELGLLRFELDLDCVTLAGDRQTASACWLMGNSAAFDDGLLYAVLLFEERPPPTLVVDPCWTII